MSDSDSPRMLTLAELAALARVSEVTVRRWVKRGVIQCIQPGGVRGKLLFYPGALKDLDRVPESLDSKTTRPNSGPLPRWKGAGPKHSQGES